VTAVRFCATSAVRDAANAEVFVAGVEQRLGVTPEVLSGAQEAQLSFVGATRTLADAEAPVLVMDIGGGSTELVLGGDDGGVGGHGRDGLVRAAHSLDIGSVRLTERFLTSDPPTADQVATVRGHVDEALDTLPSYDVDLRLARSVVAVSGTGLTVAAGTLGLPGLDRDAVDRRSVRVKDVADFVRLLVAMTVAERRALPFMHPGRADVIGAGALILERVLARVPVPEMTTSVSDILDGITWSAVEA
jgi:exopolyphosphatase / guanosine-5'-triphosphate,3'-diphosphate pyrophosphatase